MDAQLTQAAQRGGKGPVGGSQLRAPPSTGAVGGVAGGGPVSTLGTRGRVLSPPPHRHVRGALLPPRHVSHAMHIGKQRMAGVPVSSRQTGARRSGCSLSCVTAWWLHLALTVAPLLLWSTIFFPFPLVCCIFGLFRAVGCLPRRCGTLSLAFPLSCPPLSLFFLFSSTVILPLSITIPRCRRGRACACLCVTGLAHPFPSPASLASAWSCGPDAARAAHGQSLRRGCLSP